MGLFDYKFIILIGLTIVIYFIYKEVEHLRTKIDKLEQSYNMIKHIEYEMPKLPDQSIKTVEEEPVDMKQTCLVVDLVSTSTKVSPKISPKVSPKVSPKISPKVSPKANEQLSTYNNIISTSTSIDSESDSDSETISDDNEHLAIYSNDNETFDEDQNSIINSIDNEIPIKVEFNYNSEIVLDPSLNKVIPAESEQEEKTIETVPEKLETSMLSNVPPKDLSLLTLPEIKKKAEEYNIVLTKKVGNTTKPKTKKELIEEILGKK